MNQPNIFKHEREEGEGYTNISNLTLQDKNLGYGARGLLDYILSRHGIENWEINQTDLIENSPDKVSHIKKFIGELRKNGYLLQFKKRDEKTGKIKTVHKVSERPIKNWQKAYVTQTEDNKDASNRAKETQQVNGNWNLGKNKPRRLKPIPQESQQTAQANENIDFSEVVASGANANGMDIKSILKKVTPAEKKGAVRPDTTAKILTASLAAKAVFIFQWYLKKYHDMERLSWTEKHSNSFAELLEKNLIPFVAEKHNGEFPDDLVIMELAYILATIPDRYRKDINLFIPYILLEDFTKIAKHRNVKFDAYRKRKLVFVPDVFRPVFYELDKLYNNG